MKNEEKNNCDLIDSVAYSLKTKYIMKASEFRIGNIVDCFGECEIISITEKKIKVKRTSEERTLTETVPLSSLSLNPIELTEEWLMKLGACKICGFIYFSIPSLESELYFDLVDDKIINTPRLMGPFSNIIINEVKHVHQLQNLYFTLTGEELTV